MNSTSEMDGICTVIWARMDQSQDSISAATPIRLVTNHPTIQAMHNSRRDGAQCKKTMEAVTSLVKNMSFLILVVWLSRACLHEMKLTACAYTDVQLHPRVTSSSIPNGQSYRREEDAD